MSFNDTLTGTKIQLPLSEKEIKSLKAGDIVSLSGKVYTARDAAHQRLTQSLKNGETLPMDFNNCAIYYAGPAPVKEGEIIGSCGPTTSARMDFFTPLLIEKGLKVMIGKGKRSDAVIDAMKKYGAVYFAAIGGAGALIKSCVISSTLIAYNDLGCEAIYELIFKDLELVVGIDSYGNSILR